MRRASARNNSVAVRPFRAVHLKGRRFQCFSDDIFFTRPHFLVTRLSMFLLTLLFWFWFGIQLGELLGAGLGWVFVKLFVCVSLL